MASFCIIGLHRIMASITIQVDEDILDLLTLNPFQGVEIITSDMFIDRFT
jgi:hypothetical protein